MTGDLNQTLKCSCTALFIFLFIFLLSSSHTVSSSTQQIQHQNDPSSSVPIIPTHYQVFDLNNNNPIFQERFKRSLKKKKKRHKKKKTAAKNLIKPSPFSVMLPKGYIPPSRSSPCHNEYPTSMMSFHCHLNNHKN